MATTSTSVQTAGRRRTVSIALWAAQVALALFFAAAALIKLSGDPTAVAMFHLIGLGQWFRYLTGCCELAGAIGLLVPRLSGLAAMGLVGVMIGATVVNLFVISGMATAAVMTVLLAGVFVLIARARRRETRALLAAFRR
jgi:uncharacterized membrane protein YphA (DoxX/SURF4 family)